MNREQINDLFRRISYSEQPVRYTADELIELKDLALSSLDKDARIAELEAALKLEKEMTTNLIMDKYAQRLAKEKAEAALWEARKGAERYRWLRDQSHKHSVRAPSATLLDGSGIKVRFQSYGVDERHMPAMCLYGETLDAAIDQAISAAKEGGDER